MDLNLGSNDCEFPDLTTELRAFNDRIWPKAANMELERRIPDPMNSEGPKSTQSGPWRNMAPLINDSNPIT